MWKQLRIPIGVSDFRKIRENGYYYMDKSGLIEELLKTEGDFSASDFVQSVTGVDNVCERSAVKASGGGKIIQKKIGRNGVTVAFAMEEWSVEFE